MTGLGPVVTRAALVVALVGVLPRSAWTGSPVNPCPGENEYYIRLVVVADSLIDNESILGRIEGASDAHDDFDLVEIPPFSPPYLTIVFPHPGDPTRATTRSTTARPGLAPPACGRSRCARTRRVRSP